MSRRHSSRSIEERDESPGHLVEVILDEVCAKVGFIIPRDAREALSKEPPSDADYLTDAILRAEGLDPILAESGLRSSVREIVDRRLKAHRPHSTAE